MVFLVGTCKHNSWDLTLNLNEIHIIDMIVIVILHI